MRKIAVITGIRADYGILYPVLRAIEKDKNLELQLVVTGTHLSHEFGYTVKDIENDGFKIAAKVDTLLSDDTGARMGKSVGVGVLGFTQSFEMLKPDITLLMGDREEMLAAAIASLCMDIPAAHIHGGEVGTGGHIDESIRHAITKFSHIHFAATQKSAERIKKLGEEPWRVHFTGAPFVDNLKLKRLTPAAELHRKFHIDPKKALIVVVQHPLAIEAGSSGIHMEATMKAVASFNLPTIVVYPNTDAGGHKIIEVIKKYEKYPHIKSFKSFPSADYLGLLKVASVLVGNSSSGIIEAPVFKLPVVNVGVRQLGREMSENIINVEYNEAMIKKAVEKALFNEKFKKAVSSCRNFYGKGNVANTIVKILKNIKIDQKLLHKLMTY